MDKKNDHLIHVGVWEQTTETIDDLTDISSYMHIQIVVTTMVVEDVKNRDRD